MLIAQISDPHVRPRGHLYEGLVDSNTLFAAAIRHLGTLSPRPDVVVVTGDVADQGEAVEYDVARELLAGLRTPLYVIPGNHDDREGFRRAFVDHTYLPPSGLCISSSRMPARCGSSGSTSPCPDTITA